MRRSLAPAALLLAAVILVPVMAGAETNDSSEPGAPAATGPRLVIPTPLEQFATPQAQISRIIYLERCRGGCTVTKGNVNDARAMASTIPVTPGGHTISEYRDGAGETGAMADTEWAALVQCMKEVYSAYDVVITDVKPTNTTYHLAIIAGVPAEIGLNPDVLGVAPLASDCSAQDNVISFSFANAHPQTEMISRVNNLCWTAAQESAHAFGLDHEYEFTPDKRSACNDPMTYRVDCGGQKFFRNANASCGEFTTRACNCGGSQNSHLKLLSVFDEGQSLIPPPMVTLTTPKATDTTLGTVVAAQAGSKRGVSKVELIINGFMGEAKGANFGQNGQPNPSPYGITVPTNLPNSIVDVQVRAYDDLGRYTDSAVQTVTKGAPCVTADTCAKGQKCEQGKCFWDPPVGEIGAACEYPQYCISGVCRGTATKQICTEDCIPEVQDACPSGFTCVPTEPNTGICFFPDDSGCCSVAGGGGGGLPWAPVSFAALTLGVLVRPWHRRRGQR